MHTSLVKDIVGAVLHSLARNKLPGDTILLPYLIISSVVGVKSGIKGVEPGASPTLEREDTSS